MSAGTTKYCSHLSTFNLSRRGRNALPLCEGDGTDRKALFENIRKFPLQGDGGEAGWEIDSLGHDKFMYLVSRFCCWKNTGRLNHPRPIFLVPGACCMFESWFNWAVRTRTCTDSIVQFWFTVRKRVWPACGIWSQGQGLCPM